MRLDSNLDFQPETAVSGVTFARLVYRLGPGREPGDGGTEDPSQGMEPRDHEDLPYKVELWNESRTAVEQVLAVTANSSIGYAAYYAAARELPHRYVTLRHKNRIVSQWNGTGH